MSFAEIILRVGVSVGGWLIYISLALVLAVVPRATCDPTTDEFWRGTFFFGLLALAGLFCIGQGFQWRESLRWFAVPAVGLSLYAGYVIFPGLTATSLNGESLCFIANPNVPTLDGYEATTIERLWPVMQLVVLGIGVVQSLRYWREPESEEAEQ